MIGERLVKAQYVAKKRFNLVKALGWNVTIEDNMDISHLGGFTMWFHNDHGLGQMSASYGPDIGPFRKYLCVHGKGRPKKGAPKRRGYRWDRDSGHYKTRRESKEFCRKARLDPHDESL